MISNKIHQNLSNREYYRHPLHWRVAIVKNGIYHGRTHDLSLTGINILIGRNIFFTSDVIILLSIPPMHYQEKKTTTVEIQCSVLHTVLDSVHSEFRLGMKFTHFRRDGKRILSDILSKQLITKEGAY